MKTYINIKHFINSRHTCRSSKAPFPQSLLLKFIFSDYSRHQAYANSKLALLLFSCNLERLLSGTSISIVAYDPGTVDTNLYENSGRLTATGVRYFGKYLLRVRGDLNPFQISLEF